MSVYYRPILSVDPARPEGAFYLGGAWTWFTHVEVLQRDAPPKLVPARDIDRDTLSALTKVRPALAGLSWDRPRIMGILNATPDSFSDGGQFEGRAAVQAANALRVAGADIVDIGAESTRPGARLVPDQTEIERLRPVLEHLPDMSVSLDTRKASVAAYGLERGVAMINDVSGLNFDPDMATTVARTEAALCLMHTQGTPDVMQQEPSYDDVLLDVYDNLAGSISQAEAAGISRSRLMIDPGIGFGKTLEHNLALLSRIALFHSLGLPILLGVSRKGLIGKLSGEVEPSQRDPGSMALGMAAVAQGVQMLRVHNVSTHAQGLALSMALWQSNRPER